MEPAESDWKTLEDQLDDLPEVDNSKIDEEYAPGYGQPRKVKDNGEFRKPLKDNRFEAFQKIRAERAGGALNRGMGKIITKRRQDDKRAESSTQKNFEGIDIREDRMPLDEYTDLNYQPELQSVGSLWGGPIANDFATVRKDRGGFVTWRPSPI